MGTQKTGAELHHLKVFLELFRLRSVSRTAEALNMTQSSVSIVLAKLRTSFNDPLFVRSGQTMQPTARAMLMAAPLSQAMQLIEQAHNDAPEFVPADASRNFRIALADVGRLVVLPVIMQFMQENAPRLTLEVYELGSYTPEDLEDGALDLAFGFMEPRKSSLFSQKLFQETFACIVRKDHPTVSTKLTPAQLKSNSYAIVESKGNSTALGRRALELAGIKVNAGVVVPNYLGIAEVVSTSNLLAVVPQRLAIQLAQHYPLKTVRLPVKMPTYDVGQHWHGRFQHDPSHQWLRQSIYEIFHSK